MFFYICTHISDDFVFAFLQTCFIKISLQSSKEIQMVTHQSACNMGVGVGRRVGPHSVFWEEDGLGRTEIGIQYYCFIVLLQSHVL